MTLKLDLHTINAAEAALMTVFQRKAQNWKEQAANEASAGNFKVAAQMDDWSFAAHLLTSMVSSEMSALFLSQFADINSPAAEDAPEVDLSEMPEPAELAA